MRIHHVALRVAECERALAFYRDLLGLDELRRFSDGAVLRSVWLRAGDGVLMLERSLRGGGPASGSGHVLSFAVSDIPTWERRLSAAGVPIADRTSHTVFVLDPDGHRVGLSVYPLDVGREVGE